MKACILDYGSGNVASIYNMLRALDYDAIISNEIGEIQAASHLILPGVGAFARAMERIRVRLPIDALRLEVLDRHKPFLGICVGMQVLADSGEEFGVHAGLGWLGGTVRKLQTDLSLPHVGWNNVRVVHRTAALRSVPDDSDFYFLHSFAIEDLPEEAVSATCHYGSNFPAIVSRGNIIGAQFHPEKSQSAGALFLRGFMEQSEP